MKKYKNYLILVVFTMGIQALMYFSIKSVITNYNVINSVIKSLPLIKPFVLFYDLWYPFIILNTFIVYRYDKKLFNYLIITMLIGAFMSHVTFIIYPTMLERPTIEVKNIIDWILDFTYKTDTPAVNCLPSMHCVYCFITSYYILRIKNMNPKIKVSIVTFSMLIVLSTIFIKQHIIEDIILAVIYVFIAILVVNCNKNLINKIFTKLKLN